MQRRNFLKQGSAAILLLGSGEIVKLTDNYEAWNKKPVLRLPLGLPATNKFWSDAPADWTSKKAWSGQSFKKDYKVDY